MGVIMEAKDTVEDQKYSDFITCPSCGTHHVILYKHIRETQAEISFKAGYETYKEIAEEQLRAHGDVRHRAGMKESRREVGEELCCLIGNKMLEDMEAGKLLGSQLREYMRHYLKEWGL